MSKLVHFAGDDVPLWTFLLFVVALIIPYNIIVVVIAIIAALLLPKGLKKLAFYGVGLVIGLEMCGILIWIMLPS